MHTLWLLAISIALSVWLYRIIRSRFNLPPGPISLPIIGSRMFIGRPIWRWAIAERKRYPDIVCYGDVGNWVIVLNSCDAIRAALSEHGNAFSGRIRDPIMGDRPNKTGLVLNDGRNWHIHRRKALHALKDLGFARSLSQDIVNEEVEKLVCSIQEKEKKPINIAHLMSNTSCNVISRILFGKTYDNDDQQLLDMLNIMSKLMHYDSDPGTFGTLIAYIVMRVPFLMSFIPEVKQYKELLSKYYLFFEKQIAKQRKQFNPLNQPDNYVDMFLKEQFSAEGATKDEILTDGHLLTSISDLFVAGTDTSAGTLEWMCLYMATNPSVQDEVHKELLENCVPNQPVRMIDKDKLPMVQAVIEETSRCCNLAPEAVHHRAQYSAKLMGYDIPINSILIPNLAAVHTDEHIFPEPHLFKPSRFLEGGKFVSSNCVMPFSVGKRACLGETLARMELFITFATIMNHFSVTLDPMNKDDIDDILNGTDGLVHVPKDHRLIFEPII